MKIVDEIYPFDINSSIGPTGTIKRLFRNHNFFLRRGYDMTIFVLQKEKRGNGSSELKLLEITELPEEKTTTLIQSKSGTGWKSLLLSRKHEFVESNYFTASMAYYLGKKRNLSYIKAYLSLGRNPDIIVFHEMRSCYNYCKSRKDKNARVVMFLHADGSDTDMFCKRHPKLEGKREHRDLLKELQYTYEQCDSVVWISNLAKEKFCSNHPEFAHKAVTVVNGINDLPLCEQRPSTAHKYRLVSSGTVCERKGQFIIIEAMNRMNKKILSDTHLTIIGSGPDHGRLVGLCEQYGLNENVSFLGNVPNKEVPQLLGEETIYILMSNNEGLPISILEAMRAGLPVISTKIAGIPEEVDQRNGILIDPDIDQLVEVLNHLPEYDWESMGNASRHRFEQEFTFETMRSNYANMFDGLYQ